MKYNEAIETMCKRCTNYEVCQGTGCEPKKTLAEFPNTVIDQLEVKAASYQKSADWYKAKDNELHDPIVAVDFANQAQTMAEAVNAVMDALEA